jgi:hypothetical protein
VDITARDLTLRFFEIVRVLMRLDDVGRVIGKREWQRIGN